MNPTKEQLADPKWWDEHAPEGATHYAPKNHPWKAAWYIVDGVELSVMLDDGIDDVWDRRRIDAEDADGLLPRLVSRPTETPKWNGEGLPPVGVECEYYWAADDSWRSGICVAHHDGRAVICDLDNEDCAERLDSHHLRPIRTPEQIAAEEREKAVDEMVTVWKRTMGRFAEEERGLAAMLYDAGYRKVEGGEK